MQVDAVQTMGAICPNCREQVADGGLVIPGGLLRCAGCLAIFRMAGRPGVVAPPGRSTDQETVKSTSLSASAVPVPAEPPLALQLVLRVEAGPDRGRTFRVAGVELVIGRRTGEVPLTDDEVSRHHAILQGRGGRCLVRDLSSTNGTFVDGLRVTEAFIAPGQTLTVGATTIEVMEIDGTPAAG